MVRAALFGIAAMVLAFIVWVAWLMLSQGPRAIVGVNFLLAHTVYSVYFWLLEALIFSATFYVLTHGTRAPK
jgi:hypothetical protein